MPVLRDPDSCAYFKEDAGKLLVGWFEPTAKPWAVAQHLGGVGIPEGFAFDSLPADLDHISPLLERAAKRMPLLEETGIQLFFNGPESFTPDDRYLLGETPEVRDLFVACGFNSIGIQSSGGAGKVLADWMVDGAPPMDLWDVDVRRMVPFQNNAGYLRDRTVEALGLPYAIHWPYRQPESARGVRRSPLHDRLASAGACFGEMAGWERPNWYAPEGTAPVYEYSFSTPNWLQHSGREHRAVREEVGLFDYSSFAKFRMEGRDALNVLSRICANDVDVPVGSVVYTQWLNEKGTIEADVTVTREAFDRFLIVSAAATQVRDYAWPKGHVPTEASCWVSDVPSSMAVVAVMGPNSRNLLQAVTGADLSNEAFPFGRSQLLEVGYTTVRANRLSYVGELGWELYTDVECGTHMFDKILEAGSDHGLRLCGYHALNSLRLEKGYVHWGDDVTADDDPLEAGRGFAVAWEKADFIGRDALQRRKSAGLKRRRVHVLLPDGAAIMYRNEPIWCGQELVGHVTSGMYGHTVGGPVGIGYVRLGEGETPSEALFGSQAFHVEVASQRYPAQVSLAPFYDPKGERLKV
jgi:4-methylaminobutanoate oxidase (formaldehyde-forming)